MVNNCPICGRKAVVYVFDPYNGYQGDLGVYRVCCTYCRLIIEAETQTEAEEKWNKLIQPPKPFIAIDYTEMCFKRHFQYNFPCKAQGGCPYFGRCSHLKNKEGKITVLGFKED